MRISFLYLSIIKDTVQLFKKKCLRHLLQVLGHSLLRQVSAQTFTLALNAWQTLASMSSQVDSNPQTHPTNSSNTPKKCMEI